MGIQNLSALSQITTTAIDLSNLILVNPQDDIGIQPQAQGTETQNPAKFLFNFYGEQSVTLDSDITDHFVEDNTALQDQIALRPELITGSGFIGELTDIAPAGALSILKTAADRLTVISGYVPTLSVSALLAYNTAFQAYQVAKLAQGAAVSAWNSISGTGGVATPINTDTFDPATQPTQTKQQIAYQMFRGYWKQRRLFTVQTPWAIYKDCAIKTLRAIQDADSEQVTEFQVTFKPISFAKTSVVSLGQFLQNRAANQARESSPINNGDIPYNNSINLDTSFSAAYR